MISRDDLTLYRVVYTGGCVVVLGREDAERESLRLVSDPRVLSVSCEPIVWDSADERDMLWDGNGCDLGGAVLPLGEAAGLDIDPENFDAGAVLETLRAEHVIAVRQAREEAGWRTWLAVHCCCGIPDRGVSGAPFDTGKMHGPAVSA